MGGIVLARGVLVNTLVCECLKGILVVVIY